MPADERNLICQTDNVFLVELEDGRRGLIETGSGPADAYSEKERNIHGMGKGWPLMENLARLGIEPGAIEFVIFSHLHWDHAGGLARTVDGQWKPSFPRAACWAMAQEWEDAFSGDPRLYKSYPPNVKGILEQAKPSFRLVERDEEEILPGIRLVRIGGHTRGQAMILLEGREMVLRHPDHERVERLELAVHAGDTCFSHHHLRLVFQCAYDTYPLDTRAWKLAWLPRLAEKKGWLLFDHDPDFYAATVKSDPREEFVADRVWRR